MNNILTFRELLLRAAAVMLLLAPAGCGVDKQPGPEAGRPDMETPVRNTWTIGILAGEEPFELSAPEDVSNPVLTGLDVTDMEISILAHPFTVRHEGRWYVFFTAKNEEPEQGGIGMAVSYDGLRWQYGRMVLDEPYDLAYPFVFEWRGEHYMLPEAHTETTLTLYRAVDFPGEWEPEAVLLEGEHYISATPVHYGDMWWMYVCRPGNATLRLFHAPELTGPWTEHPQSPVVEDDLDTARPAGRPLVLDGRLYRLAQDCDPTYGNSVNVFEVTEISTTAYSERMLEGPLLAADGAGWNADAMHHADIHRLEDGTWIAVVDAQGMVEWE